MNLSEFKTCELVEELKKREGVGEYYVNVEERYELETEEVIVKADGPATILVVID